MRKDLCSPRAFAAPTALLAAAVLAAAPLAKADAADATDPPATTAVNPPEPAATDAPRLPAAAADQSPALKFTLTNTLRYDAAIRLRGQSPALAGLPFTANENDGDRAFNAGQIIDNRVDLLSEMDVAAKNFGARFSGSASYDGAYNSTNSIGNGSTVNANSVPFNTFAAGTTNIDGRDTQLLDAFAYVNTSFGSKKFSLRAGQHALLWGETLFFGANGIAGGMAPINIVTALSEPAAEFKEIVLPTTQVSAQLQLSSNLSVGGYFQTHWRRDILPGVGSYFSNTDIYDVGGERLLIGPVTIPTPGGPITFANAAFQRSVDEYPQNGGQFGVQFRFRPPNTGLDLGAYFIQFSEKAGVPYLAPGRNAAPPTFGEYYFVYPQGIRSFGLSASKSVGDFNLAAETSVRTNQDLISNVPNVTVGGGTNVNTLPAAAALVPEGVMTSTFTAPAVLAGAVQFGCQ